MSATSAVSSDILRIDAVTETERIVAGIREIVFRQLKRGGAVIGVSGGIDSSVVAFFCAREPWGRSAWSPFSRRKQNPLPIALRLGRTVAADYWAFGPRWRISARFCETDPVLQSAGMRRCGG